MISAHAGCAFINAPEMATLSAAPAFAENGIASRYSDLSETAKRRIIDLSSGAAKRLGFVGLEQVELSIVP